MSFVRSSQIEIGKVSQHMLCAVIDRQFIERDHLHMRLGVAQYVNHLPADQASAAGDEYIL